jgi:hypothetical protein
MTTLISWIGVDSRKPSSLYIASDSRLSWGLGRNWDRGRKVFTSKRLPHLWGYCGDVLYPSLALGQLVTAVDQYELLLTPDDPEGSHHLFVDTLKKHFEGYPSGEKRNFSILHCQRIGEGMGLKFLAWKTDWRDGGGGWSDTSLALPDESGLVVALGSGSGSFEDWNNKLKRSQIGGTSRAVFQALSLALKQGVDPLSGGAPQLVGLRRQGPGLDFAIYFKEATWLNGMTLPIPSVSRKVECFNELFERCDPSTGELLHTAQPQPWPSDLR